MQQKQIKHNNGRASTPEVTDRPENKKNHFASVADKYTKASHIIYIALAVCFLFTLIFNSKILTYNNFSYLFKDINAAADIASENYNSISYSNDNLRVTRGFRGGIVTASTTDMAIYTATGKKSLHLNETFITPEISTSKKYAIVFDQGGNNYSVYNSFSRVHNAKTTHPISSVVVGDNGWYAIISKDNTHASAVYLYDDDFNLRNSYLFASKYVFSVDINEKGNRIAIVTTEAVAEGDRFSTSVMICDPGESSARTERIVGSGIPFGCAFTSDETLQIVCSDGVTVLDANRGDLINKFEFNTDKATKMSIGRDGCAIAFSSNAGTVSNTVLVFDQNGNLVHSTDITGGISDIQYIEGYLFVNQNNSILKMDMSNGTQYIFESPEKGEDIIVYDANNILLCCQTKAKYIKF